MSVELLEKQSRMGPAIENYEIYWRHCTPNNELRRREGLPEVTESYLKDLKHRILLTDLKISSTPREAVEAKTATDSGLTTILEKYIPDPTARAQAAFEIVSTYGQ